MVRLIRTTSLDNFIYFTMKTVQARSDEANFQKILRAKILTKATQKQKPKLKVNKASRLFNFAIQGQGTNWEEI